MDHFMTLVKSAQSALFSAESQAKLNYNENALAQVAFGYSLLALATAIYNVGEDGIEIIVRQEEAHEHDLP